MFASGIVGHAARRAEVLRGTNSQGIRERDSGFRNLEQIFGVLRGKQWMRQWRSEIGLDVVTGVHLVLCS